MIPIYIAAKIFAIAPIRIHQLIRNKQISFRAFHTGVYVNQDELQRWFDAHPEQLEAWKESFKYTREYLISNGYVNSFREN